MGYRYHRMRALCLAKSAFNRRGWLWQAGYWYFMPKAYDAITEIYGEQSNNAW